MHNNAALKTIQELIVSCKDCEQDFKLFAKHAHEATLRDHYLDRAVRCHRIVRELQVHLNEQDQPIKLHGSAWGLIRRGCLHLTAPWRSSPHSKSWLIDCSHTEIKWINQMRRAVKSNILPEPVESQVTRYIHAWQHIHGQMRQLRKSPHANHATDAIHAEES